MKLFKVEVLNTLTNAVETSYILGRTARGAMHDIEDFISNNYEVLSAKVA